MSVIMHYRLPADSPCQLSGPVSFAPGDVVRWFNVYEGYRVGVVVETPEGDDLVVCGHWGGEGFSREKVYFMCLQHWFQTWLTALPEGVRL